MIKDQQINLRGKKLSVLGAWSIQPEVVEVDRIVVFKKLLYRHMNMEQDASCAGRRN